jgi:hypothetical protein
VGTYCLPIQNTLQRIFLCGGKLPWIVGHHGHLGTARSHPKNVLGGAEGKKKKRVVVESIRRSSCSNYHFIYFILFYLFSWAKFTSSPQKKWRWELLYKRLFLFLFFGKQWAQFATFMRKKNSEFAIYRQ